MTEDEWVENERTVAIFDLLNRSGRPYVRTVHRASRSTEDAARLRGATAAIGGKTLLFKVGTTADFRLLVVAGNRRTDNRLIRHAFGVQKLRFARVEELLALTGLTPGCVPPFGPPIFPLPVYVDEMLTLGDEIAFTAADHRISVRMAMADYLAVAQPAGIFAFSVDGD